MNNQQITNNGLQSADFNELKNSLLKVAKSIADIANSETGHLGDIVSGLRTNASILDLHADKLWLIFKQQKEL